MESKKKFNGLLGYFLERISSLWHFYETELASIEHKAKEGMKANEFGLRTALYLHSLYTDNEEVFIETREHGEKFLDVIISNENGKKEIQYKYKNLSELEKKGVVTDIYEAVLAYSKFVDMPVIHASNTLVMLITRFEEFISNFLKELFEMFPAKYLDSKQISYAEIVGSDIDAIRKKIIDSAIDAELRKSYTEWFKIFESHKMNLDICENELEQIKEIYVRRNVVIHNSGKVNNTYLENIKNAKYKLGESLTPNTRYLRNAFDTVETIIFCIMITANRLIDGQEDYLNGIFDLAFKQLVNCHYKTCEKVFKALSENNNCASDTQIMSKVNYWISKKKLHGLISIKKEVEQFDIKALDKRFSLAKAMLLDKYDAATLILEEMYVKKDISSDELERWPLFIDYRSTKQYLNFKLNHKEDFDMSSYKFEQDSVVLEEVATTGLVKEIDDNESA